MGSLVVGGQVGQIDVVGDPCRGAGGDLVGFGEAGQRLEGLVEASGRHTGVDLDALLARVAAGVGDVDVEADASVEAVADVDALAVVSVVRVAEVADLVALVPGGPGGGELAGGVGPSQEDVGEGVADGRAELGEQENVGNVVERAEVDDAAHVEHEEEPLEAPVEVENVTDLGVGDPEVSGHCLPRRFGTGCRRLRAGRRRPGYRGGSCTPARA